MGRSGGTVMKYALLYAAGSSLVAVLQYSQSDWVRASSPHIPIYVTVGLNFLGAAMVGVLGERVRPLATTRWRAAGLGALVAVPLFPLVYLSVLPGQLTVRQMLVAVVLFGCTGALFAAAAWLPEE